jgi:hypothetical protein
MMTIRNDSHERLTTYAKQRLALMQSIEFKGWEPLQDVGRVALVCIAKDEDDYIDEWVDYHLKLGVDRVFIYENDWRSERRDGVTTIPFDGPGRQIYAYNDFIFTNGETGIVYDWAIFIDVDEFICLKKHKTIKDFLREYGSIPSQVDGIAMNWMTFGSNNASPSGSVLERFTRRAENPERHIKLIVNLNGDRLMMGPHHSYGFWIDTNGQVGSGQNNFVPATDVIQLNHYFCKTRQEYEKKMARGRADWYVPRRPEDFDYYDKNEVEDLTALNRSSV